MALHFYTNSPDQLLKKFDAAIDQTEPKGKITTWERSDGGDYTHKADNWAKKAWFRPSIHDGRLTFNIVKTKTTNVSVPVYGYYHGHLTETFLNHFDKDFSTAQSSALPSNTDIVNAS